ncbi:isoprenyl transferase [Paenibacillus sp. 1001270B_150601_E10]|uniref:isoprenyl transferase n=1 Tax=Paenibacillus sp. 1001270B_150601_E10 TaxID=2787079 RepID=UPI00189E904B|nr:isoprenyl transferase [Paenibacillus sp. 1001270B_150601_E10]
MIKRFQEWLKGRQNRHTTEPLLEKDNVPYHVAVIMDGNGRWASKRGLPRVAGHHSGMKAVKRVTIAANDLGIKVLTMYAFSTENWKRPRDEVDFLMKLPQQFLAIELDELIENNVQVRMMGYREELPSHTIEALEEAVEKTKHNTGLILNFALNYGGKRELVEGIKEIAREVQEGKLSPDEIDESTMESHLLSHELPHPDLLIRTSGELRLSNFMLWQIAYSELWFTDVYWPEFTERHLKEAVAEYQRRSRRYGGLQ